MNHGLVLPPRHRFTRLEKRRNVEVEHARMFWLWEKGLRLVHSLKEHDPEMRWLAELFPLEVLVKGAVPSEVAQQMLRDWWDAHPEDARAAAHLMSALGNMAFFERPAAMGDSWAMGLVASARNVPEDRRFQLASASAKQGDARGNYVLAQCFRRGCGCEKDARLADELLERAAELGSYDAYRELLNYKTDSAEKVRLLTDFFSVRPHFGELKSSLDLVNERYAIDRSCGVVIFEAGEVLKGKIDVENGQVFGIKQGPNQLETFQRAVSMYDWWCDAAREACVAWILTAKQIGIQKDVRKMIVRMVWEARSEARGVPQPIEAKKVNPENEIQRI